MAFTTPSLARPGRPLSRTIGVWIDDARFAQQTPAENERDLAYAREVLAVLMRHYFGWSWLVEANTKQGIVWIRMLFGNRKYGMCLHISDAKQHDEWKRQVVMRAGELLERYGVSRGAFNVDQALDLRERSLHGARMPDGAL